MVAVGEIFLDFGLGIDGLHAVPGEGVDDVAAAAGATVIRAIKAATIILFIGLILEDQ